MKSSLNVFLMNIFRQVEQFYLLLEFFLGTPDKSDMMKDKEKYKFPVFFQLLLITLTIPKYQPWHTEVGTK